MHACHTPRLKEPSCLEQRPVLEGNRTKQPSAVRQCPHKASLSSPPGRQPGCSGLGAPASTAGGRRAWLQASRRTREEQSPSHSALVMASWHHGMCSAPWSLAAAQQSSGKSTAPQHPACSGCPLSPGLLHSPAPSVACAVSAVSAASRPSTASEISTILRTGSNARQARGGLSVGFLATARRKGPSSTPRAQLTTFG